MRNETDDENILIELIRTHKEELEKGGLNKWEINYRKDEIKRMESFISKYLKDEIK